MPTIAVDAMGGDFAPAAVVKGVAQVSTTTDIQCILVGDEKKIEEVLYSTSYNAEQVDIHHAGEAIGMAEDPKEAVRRKHDASILVAARLVERGRAAALVSGGNTGAAVLACARHFPVIPGVRKTALASVYPRQIDYQGQDPFGLLLDVGATIRCEAIELVQFALMGSAYAKRVSKIAAPRVGLLNMGREENRGGEALVEAHRRLTALADLNFVGNVEGHEIPTGRADVIVCEGFLGNVVLKLLEGLGEVVGDLASTAARDNWRWRIGLAMLSGGVGRLRELTDYATYGGAPILGFQHLFIKAHGRSTERAFGNAVKVAAKAVRDQVPAEIAAAIGQLK
jgi:glycerol-3-phosphate acyltransferase PlsX